MNEWTDDEDEAPLKGSNYKVETNTGGDIPHKNRNPHN